MLLRFGPLFLIGFSCTFASPGADGIFLFTEGKFKQANEALAPVVAANPKDADAAYYYALSALRWGDRASMEASLPLLEKSASFAPGNADLLAAYGQLCMIQARIHKSISSASKGKEALIASLAINPENLNARESLYLFYSFAPWPIGSTAKAEAQLTEIRKRAPQRSALLALNTLIAGKKYGDAFTLCDSMLAKDPTDPVALFQYGRAAAESGQNMDRGLACLKKFLELAPNGPGLPLPSNIWGRIGYFHEKMGHIEEARAAYQTSLELEPNNKAVAGALSHLVEVRR